MSKTKLNTERIIDVLKQLEAGRTAEMARGVGARSWSVAARHLCLETDGGHGGERS